VSPNYADAFLGSFDKEVLGSVSLLVVDECHCAVQDTYREEWTTLVPCLREKYFNTAPILSLSATMTAADVALYNSQMQLDSTNVVRGPVDKRRVFFTSQHKKTGKDDVGAIASMVKQITNGPKSAGPAPTAIIYFTQKSGAGGCIKMAESLRECGLKVGVVHGRGKESQAYADVCDHHMAQMQTVTDWKAGKIDVIAATCAFGLGIDHPNVQLVILYPRAPTLLSHSCHLSPHN
jgi:superfamily II DNA helicase RecQ